METFSYYLDYESPSADGFLWATLATANDYGAKILLVSEMKNGILIIFDKEILQYRIAELLMQAIATDSLNTQ